MFRLLDSNKILRSDLYAGKPCCLRVEPFDIPHPGFVPFGLKPVRSVWLAPLTARTIVSMC